MSVACSWYEFFNRLLTSQQPGIPAGCLAMCAGERGMFVSACVWLRALDDNIAEMLITYTGF